MDPFLESCSDILEALHEDCKAQIAGVTQEELDWSPGDEMNSLAVLAAHIAGGERYWISDIVMGEPSGRDRDEEFVTAGVSTDVLLSRLDSALEYTQGAFRRLTADQLAEIRKSPRGDREYTVAWSIAHVLEHTALHLGHMQITKQLLESCPTD